MATRLVAVAFDVIETLVQLEPLQERSTRQGLAPHMLELWSTRQGLAPHMLELWFTRTLRDGIALAATGDYAPFAEVAAQALRAVSGSGYQVDQARIADVLAGQGELPAHPDVLPAARLLAGAA